VISAITFWMTVAGCLLGGFAAGWFFSRSAAPDEQARRDLEQQLEETQRELQSLRSDVTDHFRGTAERVNRLTEDYRELHSHLSTGALSLCDPSSEQGQVPMLDSLAASNHSHTPSNPPLDYAPKRSPEEPGVLNENYDIDRLRP